MRSARGRGVYETRREMDREGRIEGESGGDDRRGESWEWYSNKSKQINLTISIYNEYIHYVIILVTRGNFT